MPDRYFWSVIVIMAIGTFIIRASVIFLSHKIKVTKNFEEILSFIPAAVLPALAVPMAFYFQGNNDFLFGKERVLVLLICSGIAYFSKNILISILSGLSLLYFMS